VIPEAPFSVAYRRADGNVSDKEKDLLTNLRL